MTLRWERLAALAMLCAIGCETLPASQITVVVRTDLTVGEDITHLRLQTLHPSGQPSGDDRILELGPAASGGHFAVPLSFGVVPASDRIDDRVRVAVTGLRARDVEGAELRPVVRAQAVTAFRRHYNGLLSIFLGRDCLDLLCLPDGPDGEQIADQVCDPATRLCGPIPVFEPLDPFDGAAEPASLIAHWRFEGDALDALGRFDAEERGTGLEYDAGPSGRALDLSGSGVDATAPPHVHVASDAPDDRSPGSFHFDSGSVALWLYAEDTETRAQVFEVGRPCLVHYGYVVTGGKLRWTFNAGPWCDERVFADASLTAGEWVHVVGTFSRPADGSALHMNLYVNGELHVSLDRTGDFASGGDGHVYPLVVGRHYVGLEPAEGPAQFYPFVGKVDDVRVYRGVLTQSEVTALYESY